MCRPDQTKSKTGKTSGGGESSNNDKPTETERITTTATAKTATTTATATATATTTTTATATAKTTTNTTKPQRVRRGKRDKAGEYTLVVAVPTTPKKQPKKKKKKTSSKALKKHGKDAPSGGLESVVPSLIGVVVLVTAIMAQRGFRGRASVAGIDLGTTNSVVCVQRPSKGVGTIDCVRDPLNGSPIIPSVVSVYDLHKEASAIKIGPSSKTKTLLDPHPTRVVVGHAAKKRIDTHPHQTLYNAKRVLGRPFGDVAVEELRKEVEFRIEEEATGGGDDTNHATTTTTTTTPESVFRVDGDVSLSPQQVGGYVVDFLMSLTRDFLGHDNVKSAVLAVPAKFDAHQRRRTFEAFGLAGVKVARVLEEPTAAALAYGLHKKEGVEKILVYDFGGGTLDISILHVSEGYCEVMGSDGDDRLGGADFDASVAHLLTQKHLSVLENLSAHNDAGGGGDMAELLAYSCDRITDDLPLCSVSSFHTLGEKVKISLSQQQQEQQQTDDGETTEEQQREPIVARTRCLALPAFSANERGSPSPLEPESLCESLFVEELGVALEEYNTVCEPLFDRSVVPAKRLVEDLTLRDEEIDEIVMVGGTTRMPQIRALVREAFPEAQLNTHIDPDITVAYGAASVID